MIALRQPDQVAVWFLAFFANDRAGWYRFVPGRFKHVAAFAWSEACRTWIIVDLHLFGTRLILLPPTQASVDYIAGWTMGASILRMEVRETRRLWRFGLYCVPAMAHLVGCRGALLPEGLWRSCLRQGATIVHDGRQQHTSATTAVVHTVAGPRPGA